AELQRNWEERFASYRTHHPEAAEELLRMIRGELPEGWDAHVPDLSSVEKADATRGWSGKVIQELAKGIPNLVGGSADLGGSNKTDIAGAASLLPGSPAGRIVHYGVREHAMGSIMNGMSLHGGLRPYGGTFLIFSDYMRPALRRASPTGPPAVHARWRHPTRRGAERHTPAP